MRPVGRITCSTTTPPGLLQLVRPRRRRDVDDLADARLELLEAQRPVVESGGQAEAVLDERRLPLAVAVEHPAHLRNRLVRLVDHHQRVLRQVVEERRRRLAGLPPGEVARVVLDAVAVAGLAQHLEVEHRALEEPLRLEELALSLEPRLLLEQLRLDRANRVGELRLRRHVVARRVDRDLGEPPGRLPRQRVEGADPLDLVAEELDADAALLVRRHELDDVPAHPERAAPKLVVVAVVPRVDELGEQVAAVERLALPRHQEHAVVRLGRAEAVDARDRGHDHDVAPLEEAARRREPEPVDLLVDRRLLLDVRVRLRDVGLGLVVVVVRDEVLDGVAREEGLELLVELRGERLVVGQHERRAVHLGDDRGHRERLAAAGDAEQHLVLVAAQQAGRELVDRAGLVAPRLEVAHQLELRVGRRGRQPRRLGARGAHRRSSRAGVIWTS